MDRAANTSEHSCRTSLLLVYSITCRGFVYTPTRLTISHSMPVSSRVSRAPASAIVSPMSIAPPGKAQFSLSVRRIKSSSPFSFVTPTLTEGTRLLASGALGSSRQSIRRPISGRYHVLVRVLDRKRLCLFPDSLEASHVVREQPAAGDSAHMH